MENKKYIDKLDNNLWETKGIRFTAHSRLMTKGRLSNITNGILSSYLIIFGLLSVYNLVDENTIDSNIVAFGITSISILVLLFNQIEIAHDYRVRGLSFHTCALEISVLLRELKVFKESINGSPNKSELEPAFCERVNREYAQILAKYENHKTLDYNKFKLQDLKYFKVCSLQAIKYWLVYYLDIYWLYLSLIISPIIIVFFFFMKVSE